jgi:hypothetical protein
VKIVLFKPVLLVMLELKTVIESCPGTCSLLTEFQID